MENKYITQINELIERGKELREKKDFSPEYYIWRNDMNFFVDSIVHDEQIAEQCKNHESSAYQATLDGKLMELAQLKERLLADVKQ